MCIKETDMVFTAVTEHRVCWEVEYRSDRGGELGAQTRHYLHLKLYFDGGQLALQQCAYVVDDAVRIQERVDGNQVHFNVLSRDHVGEFLVFSLQLDGERIVDAVADAGGPSLQINVRWLFLSVHGDNDIFDYGLERTYGGPLQFTLDLFHLVQLCDQIGYVKLEAGRDRDSVLCIWLRYHLTFSSMFSPSSTAIKRMCSISLRRFRELIPFRLHFFLFFSIA